MYYAGIDIHRNNIVVALEDQFRAGGQATMFSLCGDRGGVQLSLAVRLACAVG